MCSASPEGDEGDHLRFQGLFRCSQSSGVRLTAVVVVVCKIDTTVLDDSVGS